jgi:hypothetical protein
MLTERVYLKNFQKLSFELKNSIYSEIFLFGCKSRLKGGKIGWRANKELLSSLI